MEQISTSAAMESRLSVKTRKEDGRAGGENERTDRDWFGWKSIMIV